jgi:dienelactone hydrolase
LRRSVPPNRLAGVALTLAVVIAVCARPAFYHLQAAGVLLRLESPGQDPSAWELRSVGSHPVSESELTLDTPTGTARARLYEPAGERARGLVIVHGVHHLGMDEPRLVRFARSIASTGIVVMTPDVRELADYTVDGESIGTIGASTVALRNRLVGHPAVGLMGLSFAGGLGLLAAADPRFASDIAYVVSVGGHDDLARVSRFFATGRIEEANGGVLELKPHDYGPLVLVYARAGDFFPPEDAAIARQALRLWLWESRDAARRGEEGLTAASKTKLDLLFDGKIETIAPELLRDIDARGPGMRAVSPHDRLGGVHVPVFLLHGASDNVIPSTEALWLARDLPTDTPRTLLVSHLIGHVEVEGKPPLRERWAAVHFMASVLEEAHRAHAR